MTDITDIRISPPFLHGPSPIQAKRTAPGLELEATSCFIEDRGWFCAVWEKQKGRKTAPIPHWILRNFAKSTFFEWGFKASGCGKMWGCIQWEAPFEFMHVQVAGHHRGLHSGNPRFRWPIFCRSPSATSRTAYCQDGSSFFSREELCNLRPGDILVISWSPQICLSRLKLVPVVDPIVWAKVWLGGGNKFLQWNDGTLDAWNQTFNRITGSPLEARNSRR